MASGGRLLELDRIGRPYRARAGKSREEGRRIVITRFGGAFWSLSVFGARQRACSKVRGLLLSAKMRCTLLLLCRTFPSQLRIGQAIGSSRYAAECLQLREVPPDHPLTCTATAPLLRGTIHIETLAGFAGRAGVREPVLGALASAGA